MALTQTAGVAAPNMSHSFFERRTLNNFILTAILWALAVLAAIPLFSVLFMLISRGGARISLQTLSSTAPRRIHAGRRHRQRPVGTLVMVVIAAVITRAVRHPRRRLPGASRARQQDRGGSPLRRQGADRLPVDPGRRLRLTPSSSSRPGTSPPSPAASRWRSCMFPTILLTAEQAVRMVPQRMRDAAVGMGCTPTRRSGK